VHNGEKIKFGGQAKIQAPKSNRIRVNPGKSGLIRPKKIWPGFSPRFSVGVKALNVVKRCNLQGEEPG
jgi:hypothetical protein